MLWIKRVIFLMALLPMAMCQAEDEKYKAGQHYEILSQKVRTANPDKIEINEVFAYTCSHCYSFESVLHPWVEKLPADVDFQRTPAVWRSEMELYARAYYAAAVLKVLDQVHEPLFEAIHVDKKPVDSKKDIAAIFVAQGVDKDQFSQAFSSFGTTSMVNQAKAKLRSYRVQGTPEIIINGKYRVSTRKAGGFSGMLNVAEFLIAKERAAKIK